MTLNIKPAEANFGYKFMRTDLPDRPLVTADVNRVVSTNRGTVIRQGDASVSTIEHVLSALRALHVDNALLEIDGPEMPIMDGSSREFTAAIKKAGLTELDDECDFLVIEESIEFKDEETGSEYLALPADHFEATVMIDFRSPVLGQQYAHIYDLNDYEENIAPCRTFCFFA